MAGTNDGASTGDALRADSGADDLFCVLIDVGVNVALRETLEPPLAVAQVGVIES